MNNNKPENKQKQLFKGAMKGKSGTRVIDTTLFGPGEMFRINLTNKKDDKPVPQAKAFLHLNDARRMYEAVVHGRFEQVAFAQSKDKGKFFGQGGSMNNQKGHLEARELTITYKAADEQGKPRTYPYVLQIDNGKGKKPEGQNDGLVVMDGRPELSYQYYFTEAEFTAFLDSGIRGYERWVLIQELMETLGHSITTGAIPPKDEEAESAADAAKTASETKDDLIIDEDDL